ncbi:N-formylglutamate amidohydrolase [Marinobacter sp. 1Y8]
MSVQSSGTDPVALTEPDTDHADSDVTCLQKFTLVLICEHASHHIPGAFNALGLTNEQLLSHIAWDPGALGVAQQLAGLSGATLVDCKVSRLVYDCNRPPEAPDAMPEQSEVHSIPGNRNLSENERQSRIKHYYRPFEQRVATAISEATASGLPVVIVTIHSFTPVYRGNQRSTQIGILHDSDTRLADSLLRTADRHTPLSVHRNQPYSPTDGVTHTLLRHGIENALMNVMIEIRNDLIASEQQQHNMAAMLAGWLTHALNEVG